MPRMSDKHQLFFEFFVDIPKKIDLSIQKKKKLRKNKRVVYSRAIERRKLLGHSEEIAEQVVAKVE